MMRTKLVQTMFLLMMLGDAAGIAFGQAGLTAERSAEISGFAGGTVVATDYGTVQNGAMFGADYTRFFRHVYVAPSLELRGSVHPAGYGVGERVYSGGLKLEHAYTRFHVYGDFLFGKGTVKYGNGLADDSIVYTLGGGVDTDIKYHFAVKVEGEGARWHLGGTDYKHPAKLSFGLVYRVPFRRRFVR